MRIRVTTRADLFEQRKLQLVERGYRIEAADTRQRDVLVRCRSGDACLRYGGRAGCAGDQRGARLATRLVRYSMSLRTRFRFDGRCVRHPRYDPKRDGRPADGKCEGCEALYVIHLYTKIADRRANNANGVLVRTSRGRAERRAVGGPLQPPSTENK